MKRKPLDNVRVSYWTVMCWLVDTRKRSFKSGMVCGALLLFMTVVMMLMIQSAAAHV